jgi:hypothetical protein
MRKKAATNHLLKYIEDNNIDIILSQEPYVMKQKVCGFPLKYRTIFTETGETPKTAIIIANSSLQVINVSSFTCSFATFTFIEFKNNQILFSSVYCSPLEELKTKTDYLQRVVSKLKPKKIIISIDSNAHSGVWFDRNEDENGEIINDFISTNNYILLNNNQSIATFHTERNNRIIESSIDSTITSLNISSIIHNWQVIETDSLSDHRYIQFVIGTQPQDIIYKNTKKFVTKTANWVKFDENISASLQSFKQKLDDITSGDQIDDFVNEFTIKLSNCCENSMKLFKNLKHLKTNKWWNETLEELRHETNRLRRKFQRCQTESRTQHIQNYLTIKNIYTKTIREQKIKSWNSFVTESTKDNPWGLVYKLSRNQLNTEKINELIDTNGDIITDSLQIATKLMDSLFPGDRPETDDDTHIRIRQQSKRLPNDDNNDLEFSTEEVTNIVDSQNPKKTPGEDGFTADIIQRLHGKDPVFLTKLYNKCLKFSVFPKRWKSSVVKLLRKGGDRDYKIPNSYRPISLLSVFAKVFEKLLINRIIYYLNANYLLSDKQFGFSPQKSTEDALHSLKNFIEDSFSEKGYALVIAVDMIGAFDHMWWPKLIETLKVKKCPTNLLLLVNAYFEDRVAKLWYLNNEVVKELSLGCPQGSASGPHFWNIQYNDIFDYQFGSGQQIEGFADDTIIKVCSKTIPELETKAHEVLQKLIEWADTSKLKFNPLKTKCVLFTKNLKYENPQIYLQNHKLEISAHFKHLGVYFDRRLNWNTNIDYIKSKTTQITNNLLVFAKNKFGLNHKSLEAI